MRRTTLLAMLLIGTASAHVPTFAEPGSSPGTALLVDGPDQSRVFYNELAAGSQHWYRFEREAGDAIDVSLHLPAGEGERPALWIVGPDIAGEGPRQTPPGLGGQLATPTDDLGVEPFTPLAMRDVGRWNDPAAANGTYFVVIEADAVVSYSVAIGLGESFTLVEWVRIPIQRIAIMHWAGIPWPLAVVGEVLAVSAAVAAAWRRGKTLQQGLGICAAASIAGTALTTSALGLVAGVQGGFSAALAVPLVFAGIAFGIGYGAYRAVRAGHAWRGLAWAVGGLAAWAGLIVGPLALAAWCVWRMQSRSLDATSPPGRS